MRGRFRDQGGLFSYVSPEERVPQNHPLRRIQQLVRDVLKELSPSFGRLYAREGRPSVPPEQLLSALLLQVFYGIRSERQLIEHSTIICCIAGSSGSRRTTRCGIPRRSPKTASGCSEATSFRNS